jgi:glycosyltransferase involved in cell wall biosynthesis
MKILICHNFYRIRAGEARSVWEEKDLLERRGHSVLLYTKDNRDLTNISGLRKPLLFFRTAFSLSSYRELKRIVKSERPDVAHVHNIFPLISPSLYYALKTLRVPIIQVLHNYRFLCPAGTLLDSDGRICERCAGGRLFSAVRKRCYRGRISESLALAFSLKLHRILKTFNKINVFAAPSEFLRNRMIESGFDPDRIVIKRHALDFDRFRPEEGHDGYAVYMGRLAREKGLRTLLRAFSVRPSPRLEIVGDGPLMGELEERIRRQDLRHIRLHGHVESEERFRILARAAVLIFPSEWYENSPYSLIESLALGVPAVAARIGGVPEIVREDETGWLFEPGDSEGLRALVASALGNPGRLLAMRRTVRKLAEAVYGQAAGYAGLLRIYARLGLVVE